MMNRLFLAFALQAAVSSGAKTHRRKSNIRSRSSVGRHLSQNLLPWFRTSPKVDSCWGGMETNDVTGDRQPVITCEFYTHEHINSTSDIKRGTCEQFDEPSCDEQVHGACTGPFITSGKMRTTAYPDIHPDELEEEEFEHTYCARADVYHYDEKTGHQVSYDYAVRELTITFKNGSDKSDESYLVEIEPVPETLGNAMVVVIGTVAGALVVFSIMAYSLVKRKRGGIKIHEVSDAEGDNADIEKADEDEEGRLEIV